MFTRMIWVMPISFITCLRASRRRATGLAAGLVVGLSLGLAGGCAALAPEAAWVPGQTTGVDIVARRGAPTRVWPEADGGRTLEYASQPFGTWCWLLRLDAQDRLLSAVNGLAEAQRFAVVAGMSEEAVSRRLGTERSRVTFPLSGETVWDWAVAPDGNAMASGQRLRFNVHFKDGVVVRTSQSIVYPEDELPFRLR